MLNALYIAKLLNCNFKFYWKEASYNISDSEMKQFHLDKAENMYNEVFLQKHFLEQERVPSDPYLRDSKLRRAKNISHRHLVHPSWHNLPQTIISVYRWPTELFHARLVPPKFYYKILFETLPFSQIYTRTADMARETDLPADYVALHLRFGDILYRRLFREGLLFSSKTAPLQFTKMVLKKLMSEKRYVILFSEDTEILTYLTSTYKNCSTAADYLPGAELSPSRRDFFETVLMSRASQIYARPESLFASFASLIGGNIELLNLSNVASDTEKAAYMEADLRENENLYHPFHNSYSYLYLYHLTRQTVSTQQRLSFLEQAVKYDPENATLKLLRTIEYFKEGQDQVGEDRLQALFRIDFDYIKMSFNFKNPFARKGDVSWTLATLYRFDYFKPLEDAVLRGNPHAAGVMSIIYEIAGLHKVGTLLGLLGNALRMSNNRNLKKKNSLSWKMTAPIRAIGRALGLPKK
jgi:hypothetical protein